jgi:hypothetical protein
MQHTLAHTSFERTQKGRAENLKQTWLFGQSLTLEVHFSENSTLAHIHFYFRTAQYRT